MTEPAYLIYLDDYHLDDLLYLPSLAQKMGRMRRACPLCLFVHGGAGQAERLLEAQGLFPERKGGRMVVETLAQAALVERALRQVNRQIVGVLTEEGVAAVGFQGSDRGLLRQNDDGLVEAGRVGWLEALVRQRAVPVVSAFVQGAQEGSVQIVSPSAVAATLAQALTTNTLRVVVACFTRNDQPGIMEEGQPIGSLALDAVPGALLPDPDALRGLVEAGLPVLLTSATGLFGGEEWRGTMIFSVKSAKKD